MQPPESPIPDKFWKTLFTASVTIGSAALLVSLWRRSSHARGAINDQLAVMKKKNASEEEVERAVDEICGVLDIETRMKSGCSRLAVIDNTKVFLSHLRSDRENANIVSGILSIIRRSCHDDTESRVAFNRADGCKRVMIALVQAFNHGRMKLVEDAANTLKELTHIDDDSILLPYDVPKGAEGTLQLAKLPVVCNMLRNLDASKTPSLAMIIATTGVYANLCSLQAGARSIAKGVDGRSGLSFFFPLIDPTGNVLVTEHALRCVRWIAAHVPGAHAEIAEPENVRRIMSVMQLNRDNRSLTHILYINLSMLKSAKGLAFFETWFEGSGGNAIFEIMTRAADPEVRDMAGRVVQRMSQKTEPLFVEKLRKLFDQYRKAINDRRAADEQARKQQMQQQRQQQMMMQQMMMMQGGGGGMDMGDDDE